MYGVLQLGDMAGSSALNLSLFVNQIAFHALLIVKV